MPMNKSLQIAQLERMIDAHASKEKAAKIADLGWADYVDPTNHLYENWTELKDRFGIKDTAKEQEELERFKELGEEITGKADPSGPLNEDIMQQELEGLFPGTRPDIELTSQGVVITLEPWDLELKPEAGIPIVSTVEEAYPKSVVPELAHYYLQNFTGESIQETVSDEKLTDIEEWADMHPKDPSTLREQLRRKEQELRETEEEYDKAWKQVQELQEKLEEAAPPEKKERLEEKVEKMAETRKQLEEELRERREENQRLKEKVRSLEFEQPTEQSKIKGEEEVVEEEKREPRREKIEEQEEKTEIYIESEEQSEELDELKEELNDFKQEIKQVIGKIAQLVQGKQEVETIENPPPWFENITHRRPGILDTPKFVQTEKGQVAELSWSDFIQYMERVAGMDLPEIEELNKKAAPVPPNVPPDERRLLAQQAEEAADILQGFWEGYVGWRQSSQPLPQPEQRTTPKSKDVRSQVIEWVEEQKPKLDPQAVWRSLRKNIGTQQLIDVPGVGSDTEEKLRSLGINSIKDLREADPEEIANSFDVITETKAEKIVEAAKETRAEVPKEEMLQKAKDYLQQNYGMFKEEERKTTKESKRERVRETIKEKITNQTDKDPQNIWNGVEILFKPNKTVEENIQNILSVLKGQEGMEGLEEE